MKLYFRERLAAQRFIQIDDQDYDRRNLSASVTYPSKMHIVVVFVLTYDKDDSGYREYEKRTVEGRH